MPLNLLINELHVLIFKIYQHELNFLMPSEGMGLENKLVTIIGPTRVVVVSKADSSSRRKVIELFKERWYLLIKR